MRISLYNKIPTSFYERIKRQSRIINVKESIHQCNCVYAHKINVLDYMLLADQSHTPNYARFIVSVY